jgi:hypothetical protein
MTQRRLFNIVAITALFLITVSEANSQKIALLDTKLKNPIIYTDSVSVAQVSKGLLAVPVMDFDTLYSNLSYLEEVLNKRQRSLMQSFQLLTNTTQIDVSRIPMAYGDRYLIALKSVNGAITSKMTISDGQLSNKQVSGKINKLLAYLKSNNSLFVPPKEIHPRIYNVVVISDK